MSEMLLQAARRVADAISNENAKTEQRLREEIDARVDARVGERIGEILGAVEERGTYGA